MIESAPPARPGYRRAWCWAGLLGLLLPLLQPCPAVAQESARANPRDVQAAFLRNFAHYLSWPDQAFADERAPWRICILGSDPYGAVLERTFERRTEQGRSFEIVRAGTLRELPRCQIVVVALVVAENRRAALAELRNRPVLTVGDAPGFLQEGGIIRFQVSDHVEFSVNLDEARSSSLKVQTKVLEVAREVVENGIVRRRG